MQATWFVEGPGEREKIHNWPLSEKCYFPIFFDIINVCVQRANIPLYTLRIITSILLGHPWRSCTKAWLPSVQMLGKMLPPLQAPRPSVTVGSTQTRCCSPTLLLPVLALLSRKHLLLWKGSSQCPWVPGGLYRVAGQPGLGVWPSLLPHQTCIWQAGDPRLGSQRKA